MFRKLLFGAAAAGAIAWLSKNQETAKRYVERYAGQAKGMAGSAPGVGRPPAEERLNDPALAQKVESGSDVLRDGGVDWVARRRFDRHWGVQAQGITGGGGFFSSTHGGLIP